MTTFQYLDEGNSEAQDRLATSFLLAQTSPGLATTGVLSGLAVTQTTTASGAVLVAAGAAPVQASVGTGVALLVNDTQATLDVFTANPMGGLPRNDIVAFDSVTKALVAIKGEPNATPDDPTVPDTACALARLRHAASAATIPTAKIDDLRVLTGLRGTTAGLLGKSTSSTLAEASNANWVTQGGHSFSSVTVPGGVSRVIEVTLNALLNGGAVGSIVGARLLFDSTTVCAPMQFVASYSGSAGRVRMTSSEAVTLTPGAHTIVAQVSLAGGTVTAAIVSSILTVWDRGAV